MGSHPRGMGRGRGKNQDRKWTAGLPNPEASPKLTPEREGSCLLSLRHPDQGRGKLFTGSVPGPAGGNAKGSGGPTPQALGYSLPPNPDPPAVIPGVWAAVEPSVGASRPGDVPGDPSAAFPYSLWVLRGSFVAVSHEGKCVEPSGVDPFWPPRPGR